MIVQTRDSLNGQTTQIKTRLITTLPSASGAQSLSARDTARAAEASSRRCHEQVIRAHLAVRYGHRHPPPRVDVHPQRARHAAGPRGRFDEHSVDVNHVLLHHGQQAAHAVVRSPGVLRRKRGAGRCLQFSGPTFQSGNGTGVGCGEEEKLTADPVWLSASMQTEPPAVTWPVYLTTRLQESEPAPTERSGGEAEQCKLFSRRR